MNNPIVSYPRDESTPISHLPFSPAVRVGDLIFVSGQASVDKTGKIIPGTFEEEFRRSVENLRDVLVSAGSDLGPRRADAQLHPRLGELPALQQTLRPSISLRLSPPAPRSRIVCRRSCISKWNASQCPRWTEP